MLKINPLIPQGLKLLRYLEVVRYKKGFGYPGFKFEGQILRKYTFYPIVMKFKVKGYPTSRTKFPLLFLFYFFTIVEVYY